MVKRGTRREKVHVGEGDIATATEDSELYETVDTEDDPDGIFQGPSKNTEDETTEDEQDITMVLRPRSTLRRPQKEFEPMRKETEFKAPRKYRRQLDRNNLESETEPQVNKNEEGVYNYLKHAFQDMTTQIVSAIQAAFKGGNSTHSKDKVARSTSKTSNVDKNSQRNQKSVVTQSSNLSSSDSESSDLSDTDTDSASVRTSLIVEGRRHRKQNSSNNVARLPAYMGKEKWEVWRNRFEAVARIQNWDENDKLQELLPRLQGTAGDFVFDQLPQRYLSNYTKLIRELSNRFGSYESKKNYRVQFARRNQKTDETVETYAADLKRLYDKAYANRDSKIRQEDLLQRFLMGLTDDKARLHIELTKEPSTVEEAVQEVVTYFETTNYSKITDVNKGYKKQVRQVKGTQGEKQDSPKTGKLNGKKEKQNVKSYTDDDDEASSSESVKENITLRKEEIKEIFEQLYEEKMKFSANRKETNNQDRNFVSDRRNQSNKQNQQGSQFRKPLLCFHCGQPGHLAKQCYSNPNRQHKDQKLSTRNNSSTFSSSVTQGQGVAVPQPGYALN